MNEKRLNTQDILKKYAGNPALIWPDGKLTYLQYFRQIDQMSRVLSEKGIKSGDHVAIFSDVNHHFPIIFFAIIKLGCVAIPLNPKFPEKYFKEILNQFDCDALIPIESTISWDPGNQIKVIRDIVGLNQPVDGDLRIDLSFSLNQDATILLTSGSGGAPKGVLHTVGNHYYSAIGSNENILLKSDDCWMLSLPLFHIAGISILFRTMISGAAVCIPDMTRPIQQQLTEAPITHLSLVSTQLYRWLAELDESDFQSSLKAVLLGGSHIPVSLILKVIQKKLPVYKSYGSTEMSSQVTTTRSGDLLLHPDSSGKILSHRELKIDSTGEVLVRGKTLGKGYASGKIYLSFTANDGWFHTGDIGYLDDVENLIIAGRVDNMFISGGENIHPEEIEQTLQFYDHITDVCVVGIPDDEYGSIPIAFVKYDNRDDINEEDIKNYLRDKIAGFKIPKRFLSWPEDLDGMKPDREYLRKLAKDLMN